MPTPPRKMMPTDIKNDVLDVLRTTSRGKGRRPTYLTAYQILARLPAAIRRRLIAERGRAGAGAKQHYAAASVVAKAGTLLRKSHTVEIVYWDTRGSEFSIKGQISARPSFPVCGLYRARRARSWTSLMCPG